MFNYKSLKINALVNQKVTFLNPNVFVYSELVFVVEEDIGLLLLQCMDDSFVFAFRIFVARENRKTYFFLKNLKLVVSVPDKKEILLFFMVENCNVCIKELEKLT